MNFTEHCAAILAPVAGCTAKYMMALKLQALPAIGLQSN
jgi:hypothetical protein